MTECDFLGPIGNATAKYESSNPVVRRLLNRFLRRVEEAAMSLHPASVLDVGCGEGIVTERLAQRLAPATVLGVDADEGHLKEEWQARTAPISPLRRDQRTTCRSPTAASTSSAAWRFSSISRARGMRLPR